MSRHRQQESYVPARKLSEASSLAVSIDENRILEDDDYDAVDEISDSDATDEPDVEVAEELAWENEFLGASKSTPQPSTDEEQYEEWAGFDPELDHFGGDTPAQDNFDDGLIPSWAKDHADEDDTFEDTIRSVGDVNHEGLNVSFRKSVFDLSDSDDDSLNNDFPDIFMEQNKLHPSLLKHLDTNPTLEDEEGSESSYWDFNDNETPTNAAKSGKVDDSDSSDDSDSTSDESDDGDTTDDDLPVMSSAVRRRGSDESTASEETPVVRRNTRIGQKGPRLGVWLADASKGFGTIDKGGKIWKIKVVRARPQPRRFSFSAVQQGNPQNPDLLDAFPSNSGDLMMGSSYFLDAMTSAAYGPPEAFFPFVDVTPDGFVTKDSSSDISGEDFDLDDDEARLNIMDFLEWGESDEEEADHETASSALPSSTPARPTSASENQVDPLLGHLTGRVGAFRQNQDRHALISRSQATRDGLLFSGPAGQTPIRGIQKGRLAAANIPITPARRPKGRGTDLNVSPTPMNAAEARKRKFSGDQGTHKRSKSLVLEY